MYIYSLYIVVCFLSIELCKSDMIQQGKIYPVYFVADNNVYVSELNISNPDNVTYLEPVIYRSLHFTGLYLYIPIYTHTHIYTYIYIYII